MADNTHQVKVDVDFARWLNDKLMEIEPEPEFKTDLDELIYALDEAQGAVYSGSEHSTLVEIKITK